MKVFVLSVIVAKSVNYITKKLNSKLQLSQLIIWTKWYRVFKAWRVFFEILDTGWIMERFALYIHYPSISEHTISWANAFQETSCIILKSSLNEIFFLLSGISGFGPRNLAFLHMWQKISGHVHKIPEWYEKNYWGNYTSTIK